MLEYIITHMFDEFILNFSNRKGKKKRENALFSALKYIFGKSVKVVQFLHAICLWKGLEM